MANKKNTLLKLFNNGGAFLILILITFAIIFKDIEPKQLLSLAKQVNPLYLLIGVAAMMVFILCEALNIRRSLKLMGYHPRLWQCIKYSAAGFFFSSITPSASGGQPMQMYYMHRDKIELSHSALTLLIELASYQFVTVSFAILSLVTHFKMILKNLGNTQYVLFLGLAFNFGVLVFILTAIFSKKLSNSCLSLVVKLLSYFRYKKVTIFQEKAEKHLQEYQKSAGFFLNNKTTTVKIVLTNCVQIAAIHSIPYWVYRSLGLNNYSFFTIFAMQAVLYIAVSALPLPGAVGASESGFLLLFKTLFPVHILSGSMLLSRGISFYLFVLITGITLGLYSISLKNQSNMKLKSASHSSGLLRQPNKKTIS